MKAKEKEQEPQDAAKLLPIDEDGAAVGPAGVEWLLPTEELLVDRSRVVAGGGFGRVFPAKWLNTEVLVKELGTASILDTDKSSVASGSTSTVSFSWASSLQSSSKSQEHAMRVFEREAGIWFRLNHPHVVQLFGACIVDARPTFVCEYATNGSLDEFLRAHPNELWQKLHEVALGVQYLHERGIVHGDLKLNNVVVGSDLKAKVTDFGLSSALDASNHELPQITGAVHWLAPECLGNDRTLPTPESDIYSLGMCIIEALRVVEAAGSNLEKDEYRTLPWGGFNVLGSSEVTYMVKTKRRLPMRPSSCENDKHWGLVAKMCEYEPSRRMKIAAIIHFLGEFAEAQLSQTGVADLKSRRGFKGRGNFSQSLLGYLDDDQIHQWNRVRTEMLDSQVDSVRRVFYNALDPLVSRSAPKSVSKRIQSLLEEFCNTDEAFFQSFRVLDLTSRASTTSAANLKRELNAVWNILSAIRENKNDKLPPLPANDHQVDLLVAERPPMWLLSSDFDSDEHRCKFLAFLKAELDDSQRKYTVGQLAVMHNAYDAITNKSLSNVTSSRPRWFIPWQELKIGHAIPGSYGRIRQAKWLESVVVMKRVALPDDGTGRQAKPSPALLADLKREADIWFKLSHPHVIRLYGACHVGDPFFVCEYGSQGSFGYYMRKHPTEVCLKMHEVALGIQYLHQRGIVHGDIKCSSFVMGGDNKAKVASFAFSASDDHSLDEDEVALGDIEEEEVSRSEAWQWMAPECLRDEKPTFESDIYSLGMTIVEALRFASRRTRPSPWGILNRSALKYHVAHRGALPNQPHNCTDEVWHLIQRMCRHNPGDRISIHDVVLELRKLVESIA